MQKIALVLSFILVAFVNFSQKELTLEDAVLNQYRAFYPERIAGFNWIPNSQDYSYLEGFVNLVIVLGKTGKSRTIPITEVNKALGAKLRWFSGFEWKDAQSFYVADEQSTYLYNSQTGTGAKISTSPEGSENHTLHGKSGRVAFTEGNNLFILNETGKKVAVTSEPAHIVSGKAIARSEFGIKGGIFWSPEGNLLAFYQKDEAAVAEYPLLDITETPGKTNMIRYPMTGQKSEHPKVGIFNLSTGKAVYIEPRGAKDDYLTNVSWSPDEKHLVLAEVNRDQNHMKLQLYNAQTGQFIRTILEEKSDKWVEPEFPAYFFSTNPEQFIWMSEKDGYMNLYLCSTSTGFVKQLTANKWVATGIVGHHPKGTEIYFTGTGESPLESKLFSVNLQSGQQQVLTPAAGTHQAVISPDGQRIFDQYSSSTVPNVAQIIDRKGKIIRNLVTGTNKLAGYTMGTAEIGTLQGADGTTLYTRLIKPSNFDPNKKYPVLVYVYGGPHAQLITNSWLDGASLWMYWMAEQGYLVFTLDNRGSSNRGFAFESGIHRQLGTLEVEDQLTGVNYLKSLPFVDGKRLAVHGWSYGGFMTGSLMLRHPGVFTTGVAGGPVTDWKYYEIMYGERYMDTPEQNADGYAAASLLNKADKLEGKLLLIHGTIDDVVVMQHSHSLIKAFVDKGKQMDFFVYPMHEHNVSGKDRVHLMRKVLTYVLENNK